MEAVEMYYAAACLLVAHNTAAIPAIEQNFHTRYFYWPKKFIQFKIDSILLTFH
jgi:hypothetical protein